MISFSSVVPPELLLSPSREIQILSPDPFLLSCYAEGFPIPEIIWISTLSNGSPVIYNSSTPLPDGRNVVISMEQGSYSITSNFSISSTIAGETGNYTCRASNILGDINSNFSVVSVLGKF